MLDDVSVLPAFQEDLSLTYHLATNAVDGDASSAPLLHIFDHTLSLAIVGNVKVVIVDVQLGVGVGSASGLKGNADVVLAEDIEPVALPEGSVLVEDLVANVLELVSFKFDDCLCLRALTHA
jgi:hypothetical protein